MPRKPPTHAIGSADDVEAEFYDAMQAGDLERLMAVWSDDDDITLVHPGGPRLVGAAAIRASFEAMFGQGAIDARPEHVRRVETLSSAVHSVLERVRVATAEGERHAHVVATNVYVKTPRGWRLAVHHASPGNEAAAAAVESVASTLH